MFNTVQLYHTYSHVKKSGYALIEKFLSKKTMKSLYFVSETLQTSSSRNNGADVGLLLSYFIAFFHRFHSINKGSSNPSFPSVLSRPTRESGLRQEARSPRCAFPPLPEEPPWGTRGRALILEQKDLTPSTPGRTRCHNDRLEERKENTSSRKRRSFVCLVPRETVCVGRFMSVILIRSRWHGGWESEWREI